ncbi:dTMP kinase [Desulfovibrio sp. OttesenSCG-928-F07]|nr:dTMP kinase [Desulfovibrio sp. OttesenSCG-928-F07]
MFITFEGIEGSGKGTVIKRTASFLEDAGYNILLTREPGGSRLGLSLRAMLLDSANTDICPEAELFMYLADRTQHMYQVIRPALKHGKMVISDRFADSTIVYQGYGRGLPLETLFDLNNIAVGGFWPDLTIVLDLEPEIGLARAIKRNAELGLATAEGRFEAEAMSFHHKVREGYKAWAAKHPERIVVIDASGSEDDVFSRVQLAVRNKILNLQELI